MNRSFGSLMEVARIQSELNQLFDNLLDLGEGGESTEQWMPSADILESQENLIVKVDLPGVIPDDLRVSVTSGNLVIEGQKPRQPLPDGSGAQLSERRFGRFRRVIQIGVPVNTRLAEAELKNGLLRICFPKVPNRRGEAVPIEVSAV